MQYKRSTTPSTSEFRGRRLAVAIGWGFVALVVYLSLTRIPPDLRIGVELDFGHVVAYFWLMIWFAQLYRSVAARIWLGIGLFSMGVALEYLQGAMGYRHFDYADMLRNLSGLTAGFLLAMTPMQNLLRAVESRAISRRRSA